MGTGYAGLVTGACMAENGHDVILVDVDADKIATINRGVSPIHEPGLEDMLRTHIGKGLTATTDHAAAVAASDLTFIVVGTPFDGERIDLTHLKEASRMVGTALSRKPDYHVVVVRSTVVPGTTDKVVRPILEKHSGKSAGADFGLGMIPEFLTEGEAIGDSMFPDRIVLGGIDARTQDAMDSLYAVFEGVERIRTNTTTAEMIKYASNALLATLISFSNELANLGQAVGDTDIVDVMRGLHSSRYLSDTSPAGEKTASRITSFLMAGCGFGGSCLPKDVNALISHGNVLGYRMELLESVLKVNRIQFEQIFKRLDKHFPDLKDKRVGVLGLAFRPGTDDVRESPAFPVIRRLLKLGARVTAYDPVAGENAARFLPDEVIMAPSLPAALGDADAIVLITGWEEFEQVPGLLTGLREPPLVVDGRRMLDKGQVARYEGIGL